MGERGKNKGPGGGGKGKAPKTAVRPNRSIWSAVKHWSGKLVEHEVLTLTAKAIFWLLEKSPYVVGFLAGLVALLAEEIERGSENRILLYLADHPERVSIAAIALVVFAPVIRGIFSALWTRISLLWSTRIASGGHSQDDVELSSAEALVQATGISAFSPHRTKKEKDDDWKSCNEKIRSNKAIDLRIMGATGWNTFGHSKAPLHKLLKQFTGEVKILLMKPDPTLPALIQRAAETGRTPHQYVAEIENSIAFLKQLKQQYGKNLSLKVYSQTPIWKMLISNDYMWLQHYNKSKNVEDTPVYTFFSDGDEGTSLFHALYSVWLKRWNVDGNLEVDLTQP